MFEIPDSILLSDRTKLHIWKDDATFVDIIHTTAGTLLSDGSLGMSSTVGHADFFPNGGQKNQPGCHQVGRKPNFRFQNTFINSPLRLVELRF